MFFTSCGDPGDGDALPGGKYPVTFTAAVDGLAVSRATTDGTWTADDGIAVRVGDVVKRYSPASINGNSAVLAGTDAANTFYWQTSGETKTVSAWCPGTGYNATLPATWAVLADQRGNGYRQSDFLYAPGTDIAFSDRGTASLPFYHQTARVVVNIVKAEAATSAADISDITIGYNDNLTLSGTYTAPAANATTGTWTTDAADHPAMGTITPRDITADGGSYLKTYAALVIPRNMNGKKFIAVTTADGDTYYYTPANDNDANLEGGKQYTYTITVKHGKLEVTSSDITGWTGDGSGGQEIESYISGSGTVSDPFRVTSLEDFKKINDNLGAHYLQTADIDMNNESFDGIGDGTQYTPSFTGTYDGGGHEIQNVNISGEAWISGLFQQNRGTIKNVNITSGEAKGKAAYSGVICGINNSGGTITNCTNAATMTGTNHNVGGICGLNYGRISDCKNSGEIKMEGNWNEYGGICGTNDRGTISGCTNTGTVVAGTNHNPICGGQRGTITNCTPPDQNTK